jgi:hypothetical protein
MIRKRDVALVVVALGIMVSSLIYGVTTKIEPEKGPLLITHYHTINSNKDN